MWSEYRFSIAVPLPPDILPQQLLDHLQTITPVFEHIESYKSWYEIPPDPVYFADDEFFGPLAENINHAFCVSEVYELAPGLKRRSNCLVLAQNAPDGLRFRVTNHLGSSFTSLRLIGLWAKWTIRPRASTPYSTDSTPPATQDWELVDDVVFKTNRIAMSWVAPIAERAHDEICHNLMEDMAKKRSNAK